MNSPVNESETIPRRLPVVCASRELDKPAKSRIVMKQVDNVVTVLESENGDNNTVNFLYVF
jgi:hypothetical protein